MTPISAVVILSVAIAIEIMQRMNLVSSSLLTNTTSVVNWISLLIIIVLSILVRKFYFSCMIVGPFLTLFCFYYFCVVDFDGQISQIYNVIIVGITLTYLILVFFLETWITHAITSFPVFGVLLWRQKSEIIVDDTWQVAVRFIFMALIYCIISYRIDQ